MADRSEYEILVIEHDKILGNRIKSALTGAGFRVQCETSSPSALEILEAKEDPSFCLVISSFRMPGMDGDKILERVKLISPSTQRMIITDPAEMKTVIGAVNRAEIHGCLAIPFTDENLLFQVKKCLQAYALEEKRANLIKVTERQNWQMYKLAKNFKRRDDSFRSQIEEKEKQIRVLKSRIRSRSAESDHPLTLARVFEHNAVPFSPDAFVSEFRNISRRLLNLLNSACLDKDFKLEPMEYEGAISASFLSDFCEPMDKVFSLVFAEAMAGERESSSVKDQPAGKYLLAEYIDLVISEDRLRVLAQIKKFDPEIVTVDAVMESLEQLEIRFGIMDEALIKSWLSLETHNGEPFVIAQGVEPKPPVNAEVRYDFPTDFLHAGKIKSDGSMDFRERGNIPFVTKGVLLAEKSMPMDGRPGTDVSGIEIPVAQAVDVIFRAGPGTRSSDDGLMIYADSDGQPHLDAMGNVSVFRELTIDGDVDFETGNIDFKGNIVVSGVVKEGFSVRGATLTAGQIEGAEIELTGDLNVEGGIIDAKLIRVQGSVQAKYVNNSVIRAFGNLMVQKEIIDSAILLSGACINQSGNIIASTIIAKKGVQAVQIGTETSSPSRIRVGVDDHIKSLLAGVNKQIEKNIDQVGAIKGEIMALETEDHGLHMKISDSAHIQDRSQVELKKIEKRMGELKASGDLLELDKLTKMVRKLYRIAQVAGEGLDQAFQRQDFIVKEVQQRKQQIAALEDHNKVLVHEKIALVEFSKKTEARPEVIIAKRAMPGTMIEGPNAALKIKAVISRSRILELKRDGDGEGGLSFFEMAISSIA